MTETIKTDVVVIGASVAGNTAATLFAQQGLSVLLVDRVTDPAAYKRQCTHFVQPVGTPVFERLGVIDAIERAGAIRGGLQVWTPQGGWARLTRTGQRDAAGGKLHGYTLRREKLDPILRERAASTPGVTLRLGASVE